MGSQSPGVAEAEQCGGESIQNEQDLEGRYGPRTGANNLRARKAPRYDINSLLALDEIDLNWLAMAKYGMNAGIRKFFEQGESAVQKEMKQITTEQYFGQGITRN